MDRVARIGLLFNLLAMASYLTIAGYVAVSYPLDHVFVSVLLANLWSAGATLRFVLALKRHKKWGIDLAANWGFFLAVGQFVAFQVTAYDAIYSYVAFALVTGQLLIVYHPTRSIAFTGLLSVLYGIRLASTGDTRMLIIVAGLWGFGVLFRLALSFLIKELDAQRALFMKARWAASELTDVLLHLDAQLEEARATERTQMQQRLAREIHDGVGYMLTALIVQIGAVREISVSDSVGARLTKLEDLARDTLRGIRQEVTSLRSRPTRTSQVVGAYDRITQLCALFAECTGVNIQLNMREDLRVHLDGTSAGEAIYRIVQEAVTNSYRHGQAERIDITLRIDEMKNLLLLLVSDNGRGCKRFKFGNGLSGILERTRSVGGTMKTNTAPGRGFDVGIDIPLAS